MSAEKPRTYYNKASNRVLFDNTLCWQDKYKIDTFQG